MFKTAKRSTRSFVTDQTPCAPQCEGWETVNTRPGQVVRLLKCATPVSYTDCKNCFNSLERGVRSPATPREITAPKNRRHQVARTARVLLVCRKTQPRRTMIATLSERSTLLICFARRTKRSQSHRISSTTLQQRPHRKRRPSLFPT